MESMPRQLFARYHLRVYRYFLGHERRAVAEELAQDVFLRVIKSMETYEPRGREVAWLFTIARRVLLDFRRQHYRERTLTRPQVEGVESRSGPRQFTRMSIRETLSGLPEAQRDAFLLREVSGLSYAEIATLRDISPSAVRSLLHRARQSLRAALADQHHEEGYRKHVHTTRP